MLFDRNYEEVKINVQSFFKESFDIDTAMFMAQVSPNQRKMLESDAEFMFSLELAKADVRREIMSTLLRCMRSDDEKLAHTAANNLGKILDKERFLGKPDENKNTQVPDTINLRGVSSKTTKEDSKKDMLLSTAVVQDFKAEDVE